MRRRKVYFEVVGFEEEKDFDGVNNNPRNWHQIIAYVKPSKYGHGYHYRTDGSMYQFSWCNYKIAKCVLSSDLPVELWYSISHGVSNFKQLAKDGERSLRNEDIDILSLVFDEVTPIQVELYEKAKKAMRNITHYPYPWNIFMKNVHIDEVNDDYDNVNDIVKWMNSLKV